MPEPETSYNARRDRLEIINQARAIVTARAYEPEGKDPGATEELRPPGGTPHRRRRSALLSPAVAFQRQDPERASQFTQLNAGRWSEKLLAAAAERKVNIVFETTMRTRKTSPASSGWRVTPAMTSKRGQPAPQLAGQSLSLRGDVAFGRCCVHAAAACP